MDHSFGGGGNWTMIPSVQAHSGSPAHSNQDQFYLSPQQQQQPQFTQIEKRGDYKVNELNTHFDKCQHLLNSISSSINAKAMTVEGQKRKLEESEQLLNQRRELIGKYRNSVEELLNCVVDMGNNVAVDVFVNLLHSLYSSIPPVVSSPHGPMASSSPSSASVSNPSSANSSPLAAGSSSSPSAGLQLMVDLSSYKLPQVPSLQLSPPASPIREALLEFRLKFW
ncbi:hypothetical protein SADUNF_Sadunf03G0023400 [Salix dunnii]|uniref:Uncharacterized protein n=1 Tax=Salix dunnii TaxID=1413687 RepID=A0A835KGU6_9ROSI|nr:hypothetical protein SADUNF_Sadunf03G0023400 [Salix dunnii]